MSTTCPNGFEIVDSLAGAKREGLKGPHSGHYICEPSLIRIRALEAELAEMREYESLALSEAEARGKAEAERDALKAGKHRCGLADGTWMPNHTCQEVNALKARVAELGDFYVHHQGVCKDCHCEHVGGGRESGDRTVKAEGEAEANGPSPVERVSSAAANPAADEPCEHGIFDCEECGG